MFVPPEDRRPGLPPRPEGGLSKRSEAVLLWLIGVFLLSMLLGPIAGASLIQALLALSGRS